MSSEDPEKAKSKAIEALTSRAWLVEQQARELVDVAVGGAVEQALDTITGATFLPTTMTGVRAERLYYICRAAKRWLSQREVEVLFRVTPTTAHSIMATAQAVYEAELNVYLTEQMRSRVLARPIGTATDPKVRLRCSDASTYNTLMNEIHRLGLDNAFDEGPGRYEVTFSENVTVQGNSRPVFDVLKIPKPTGWPKR